MFTNDFIFNMKDAIRKPELAQYGGAHHTTNEPVAEWMKLTPVKNPRVLTVASSGDHALMYAANGAAQVNTFDISINACAVMDFKTTALQSLTYSEYKSTVNKLHNLKNIGALDRTGLRSKNKHILHTVKNMPDRTRDLMKNIIRHRPDAFNQSPRNPVTYPSDPATFAHIKEVCKNPFNFIWCDIKHLPYYMGGVYNIINISNIFDFCLYRGDTEMQIYSMTLDLASFLNTGDYMLCTSDKWYRDAVINILRKLPKEDVRVTVPKMQPEFNDWQPIVIQKIR